MEAAMTPSAILDDQQVRIVTHHSYDVTKCWRDTRESVMGDLYYEGKAAAAEMGVSRLGNGDDNPSKTNGPFFFYKFS